MKTTKTVREILKKLQRGKIMPINHKEEYKQKEIDQALSELRAIIGMKKKDYSFLEMPELKKEIYNNAINEILNLLK